MQVLYIIVGKEKRSEMPSQPVYTGTGDRGTTSLVDGSRLSKSSLRLDSYGTVDELSSALGLLIAFLEDHGQKELFKEEISFVQTIQNDLFSIGSHLACENKSMREQLPPIPGERISQLEKEMDHYADVLPELKEFILPGGAIPAAQAHMARTICRRAERKIVGLLEQAHVEDKLVQYLNRLSDYLYVLSRNINHKLEHKESTWKK